MVTGMDLNNKGALFPHEHLRLDNLGDTALSLNCLSFEGGDKGMVRNGLNKFSESDDGCGLVLGLGPTPSACFDGYGKGKGLVVSQGLASGCDSVLKLGFSGLTKESVSILEGSVSGRSSNNNVVIGQQDRVLIHVVDEGSTTAKKSGGYMPSLLLAPRMDLTSSLQTRKLLEFGPNMLQVSSEVEISTSMETVSENTTTMTSSSNPKKCKFVGCSKGARGASGLCIGHGGGQRCQKSGCNKGAESRTAYCKAHGGGRRCDHLGCTKSAEGKTDYCIAHGGGRRCSHSDGCTKAARGRSGLCIRHGGGKRCKIDGCTRSAEGHAGLCISHGGGRRCKYPECKKGAQGSTMYCKAHGGGKRCVFAGCTKGAEGSTPLCKGHGGGKRCLYDGGGICPKSVHGGTNFCVAHGGGKRCSIPGCTKSARGRTDCCVRHGGGKRCKHANCNKSAQGSTDFCKAHGGGKRCTWPEGKCEKFARGKSGLCAAHSSMAQERETNRGGLIGPGLFRGLVSVASTSSGLSVASDCTESLERPAKRRQHLIPPQVLVPLSMKASSSFLPYSRPDKPGKPDEGSSSFKSFNEMIPEGRVHGGGLMSLFGGNLNNAIDGI